MFTNPISDGVGAPLLRRDLVGDAPHDLFRLGRERFQDVGRVLGDAGAVDEIAALEERNGDVAAASIGVAIQQLRDAGQRRPSDIGVAVLRCRVIDHRSHHAHDQFTLVVVDAVHTLQRLPGQVAGERHHGTGIGIAACRAGGQRGVLRAAAAPTGAIFVGLQAQLDGDAYAGGEGIKADLIRRAAHQRGRGLARIDARVGDERFEGLRPLGLLAEQGGDGRERELEGNAGQGCRDALQHVLEFGRA